MKKLMFMAVSGVAVLSMVGCAMFGSDKKEQGDVIAKYKKERMPLVVVESGLSKDVPIIATAFYPISAIVGNIYIPIAKEVDDVADLTKGRRPYIGYVNDVKALVAQGKTAEEAKKEINSKLQPETIDLIKKYEDFLNKTDLEAAIARLTKTLAIIANETTIIATKLAELLNNPGIKELSGMKMFSAAKTLKGDFGKLGYQLGDAGTGANLLIKLYMEDQQAKAYMKDYPLN